MNSAWLYFFLDLCIAAAILFGPGSVFFRLAGFRLETSICLSPCFSLSVFVLVGILLWFAGVNVSNVNFLLIFLLAILLFLILGAISRLYRKKRPSHMQLDSQNGPSFSTIVLYLLIAAIFVSALFILPIDGPNSFSTSNDSSAHLDFIRAFVESGTYSTLHVSQDANNVALSGFYPAAYHVFCSAITALPGCTVNMASNIAVVLICGAVYPLGSLLILSRLFGSKSLETRLGALACIGNVGFPWSFLVWGQLASNLLAFALVPSFVYLFWELLFPSENNSFCRVFVSLFVALFAMVIAQPNAVFTGGIFCIPIIFCFVRNRILVMNPSFCKSHFSISLFSFLLVALFIFVIWTALYLSPVLSGVVHFFWSNDASLGQAIVSALELKYGGMFEIQYLVAPLLLFGLLLSFSRSSVKYVCWLYLFCTFLFIASYTTEAGSTPSSLFTISAPALFAHISNCSTAAALKVSAAATTTFLPSFANLFAIFPIDVVFPTPFTPTTKITDGFVFKCKLMSVTSNIFFISSLNAFFTSSSSCILSFFILFLKLLIILTDVSTPMSDIIRTSSNSSKNSSSTFLKLLNTLFIFSSNELLVLFIPCFNFSKNPMFSPFIF